MYFLNRNISLLFILIYLVLLGGFAAVFPSYTFADRCEGTMTCMNCRETYDELGFPTGNSCSTSYGTFTIPCEAYVCGGNVCAMGGTNAAPAPGATCASSPGESGYMGGSGGMGMSMNSMNMSTMSGPMSPEGGYQPVCTKTWEGPYCDCVDNTAWTYMRQYPYCRDDEYNYTSIIDCGAYTCDDTPYTSCTCNPPPGETPTPTAPTITVTNTPTPPTSTPTPTPSPIQMTCDSNIGVCGCVPGTGCRDGIDTDYRCCHRECRNNACTTVSGSGPNDSSCTSGSDGQACGTSTPGCFVGKACSTCGPGGAGNCSDCGGGWCNGGFCSTCNVPTGPPSDPTCYASFSCFGFTAAKSTTPSTFARGLARGTDYNLTNVGFSTNNSLTVKPGDTVVFSTFKGGINDNNRGIMGNSNKSIVRTQFITRNVTSGTSVNDVMGSCIMAVGPSEFRANWCQGGVSKIGWNNTSNSDWPTGFWPYSSYASTPSGFSTYNAQVVPAATFSVSTTEAGVARVFSGTCNRFRKQQSCCAVTKTSNGPPEQWTCTNTGEDPDTCSSRVFSPASCQVDDLGTSAAPDELARGRTMRRTFASAGTYVVEATEQFACGSGGDNNNNPCVIRVNVQPTYHEIRGYVYIDENKNGNKDGGEPSYQGEFVVSQVIPGAIVSKSDGATGNGTFSITNVPASTSGYDIRVYLQNFPQGYQISYPKAGAGFSYRVKPGLPCAAEPITNPAPGVAGDGSCESSTGNIINLNFGITASNPWMQFTGLDVRVDEGFTSINSLPPTTVDYTCRDPKASAASGYTGFSAISNYAP